MVSMHYVSPVFMDFSPNTGFFSQKKNQVASFYFPSSDHNGGTKARFMLGDGKNWTHAVESKWDRTPLSPVANYTNRGGGGFSILTEFFSIHTGFFSIYTEFFSSRTVFFPIYHSSALKRSRVFCAQYAATVPKNCDYRKFAA